MLSRPAPVGPGGCVYPRVFRAPEAPAAREARRPHFVRRRASKPARALRSLRRPPHQWAWCADGWLGALSCAPARPRHRPRAPQPGPPVPPAPSTPVGAGVLACGWVRRLVVRLWLSISNFACNSPTALSNPEIRSLELQRFLTLLKLHPIELHATFLRPGPATTHGRRGLAPSARWPGCLKPASPLRAGEVGQLKPASPLRVRNGCFWCIFRVQR